jgi:MFS family permease
MSYWVDKESIYSLDNWTQQIGLICRPGWQIGLIGSLYFAGWCSSLLWLPQYAETLGKKWLFVYTLIAFCVLSYIITITRSYTVMVISFYWLGFFMGPKTGVGWPYLLELVPKSTRAAHAAAFGILGGTMAIVGTVYFVFISKNAYWLLLATFIC